MGHNTCKVIPLLFFSPLFFSHQSAAGGLWLNEYGTPAMGRARAGAAAGVNDASTVHHNPATMSRLEREQWMASGGIVYSSVEFDLERNSLVNGTDAGDDAGGLAPGASVFYVNPHFNGQWSWGISAAALAGSVLDYDDSWAGRFQATEVNLATVGVAPGLSYQVNDWLSLGANLQLVYARLEVKLEVPIVNQEAKIDGDDTRLGYVLGAAAELTPHTRIGLVYQSELDFEFSGDAKLPAGSNVGVDTGLPLAAYTRLALTHELNDAFNLHATWGWDDWGSLDNVNLTTNSGGVALAANWDDTYHYALGLEYKASAQWTFSTGVAYDTNPVSKYDRNAQLPVDRQVRYAFGAQYQQRDNFSLGGQLVYADLGKAKIEGLGYGGEFETNQVFFISINANWWL
ncbi:outer membrane protein transport protein [Maricurvus nonylphenolicus]|uniref:OmpP1/FadL family transporter n=1 Tax=Maricurvus nonylphenolicus TaxID=1008307 RepID=UPI0036F3B74C